MALRDLKKNKPSELVQSFPFIRQYVPLRRLEGCQKRITMVCTMDQRLDVYPENHR
jgi:hypothetical protein